MTVPTTDDLLARMRDEAAGWHRAPVLSGERESAGARLVAAVLKLDELLSSDAPLPPDWTDGLLGAVRKARAVELCRPLMEASDEALERAEAAERKLAALDAALRNALEGLEEMLPYVPEFFRDKWDLDAYVTRAKGALAKIGSENEGGGGCG